MTSPISAGYPDWARLSLETSIVEMEAVGAVIDAPFTWSNRYIGNCRALFLSAKPTGVAMRFEPRFWVDAGSGVLLDSYPFDAQDGDLVRAFIPALSPYLSLDVTPAAAGAFSYDLKAVRTPEVSYPVGLAGDLAMFSQDNAPIGGSATVNLDCVNVTPGPAVWSVNMSGGNWSARVYAVDLHGTLTLLDVIDQTVTPWPARLINLPGQHVRVRLINGNVAAQTYELVMTRAHRH